jgi:1,4-alpha-glucan branching enzyme
MLMTTTSVENAHVGMGAIPHASGVAFRVWAPHAGTVHVTGSFNKWSSDAHPMAKEEDGYWYASTSSTQHAVLPDPD